jgi:hypothetical protein
VPILLPGSFYQDISAKLQYSFFNSKHYTMKKKSITKLCISKTTVRNLSPEKTIQVKGGSHIGCGSVSNWLLCPPPTDFSCYDC